MATTNVPPSSTQPPPVQAPCCCPACLGLRCLERPRFFAGQLLTEADFNSEQDYILAKSRLHNRYLHGPGVVCGLQVVCHHCDGAVIVQPGYAIDPCGNDIVVCEPATLDIVQAIEESCAARRRKQRSGCNQFSTAKDDPCNQAVQNWCIAIEYQERESRGTMPLRNQPCSCGGNSGCQCHANGNGKAAGPSGRHRGKSGNGSCACTPPRPAPVQPAQCEPTRVLETYKLTVVEKCASNTVTQGTLLGAFKECGNTLQTFYAQFTPQVRAILQTVMSGGVPNVTAAELLDACCRMRQALITLIASNEFSVHCQIGANLPLCTSVSGNTDALAAIKQMIDILEQLMLDCACRALMPPCSADPCEDRVILACITLRQGRIIDICNFDCRTYAGSFPAMYYWLSAFPIFNQIFAEIRRFCCGTEIAKQIDPANTFRFAARSAGFAAPRAFAANLDAMLDRFSLESIANLAGPGSISLPALVGQPVNQVERTLEQANIAFVQQIVQSAADVPPPSSPTANLFASPGQKVVVYVARDTVVGFGPFDLARDVADLRAQVAELQQQLGSRKRK